MTPSSGLISRTSHDKPALIQTKLSIFMLALNTACIASDLSAVFLFWAACHETSPRHAARLLERKFLPDRSASAENKPVSIRSNHPAAGILLDVRRCACSIRRKIRRSCYARVTVSGFAQSLARNSKDRQSSRREPSEMDGRPRRGELSGESESM